MPDLRIQIDDRQVQKALGDLASKQIPYATAVALNDIAFQVQRAERANMQSTFTNPRPFTVRSVLVDKADKHSLTATVYVRPEVAKYIQPYETGGAHVLPGKALLNPKNVSLDQYGQLRKGMIQRLMGRPDVFAGRITFRKSGQTISGIWQRPPRGDRRNGGRGTTGALNAAMGALTGLKLLVRFGDDLPVTKHLECHRRTTETVKAGIDAAFANTLARVMK